jgi:hypothetical protein
MADRLRFHSLVAADLRDALRWYDDISPRLGNRFREMSTAVVTTSSRIRMDFPMRLTMFALHAFDDSHTSFSFAK